MAVKATPLSYLWTKKEALDYLRSSLGEHDDQLITDDNILAALQTTIMEFHKIIPAIRADYTVQIPFVVDTTDDPRVSTVPPAAATNRMPYHVIHVPEGAASPLPAETSLGSGIYDFHYEHPENFEVIGWRDMWNDFSGSCRRTSDYSQLMGISLGNNTQLSRIVAWYNEGRQLYLVVRENVPVGTIITGQAIRTVIPMIQLNKVAGDVPTGIAADTVATVKDERYRYAPDQDLWAKIDLPDDYFGLAAKATMIKLWGIVGKNPTEQMQASVDAQVAQLTQSMDAAHLNHQNTIKDTQWKDRGHL